MAGEYMTEAIAGATYSSIVLWDSVCQAFMLESLYGIDTIACDVSIAYLNAPCRKKIWFWGWQGVW